MTPRLLLERQTRILNQLAQLENDLRDNSDKLAEAIRQKRDELGLCNVDLAERTKLPYTSVVNWVYGNNMLPEKEAQKILAVLKTASKGPIPLAQRKKKRKLLTR